MSSCLAAMRLILFFSRGVSLKAWSDIGLLEREAALYRRLKPKLRGIDFVTYGDAQDRVYGARLAGIRVRCNRWRLPGEAYQKMVTRIVPWSWRGPVVVKSNQIQGAEIALEAARRAGKPFVARCGYLLSDNMARTYGTESAQAVSSRALEHRVFSGADRVVVTTPAIREKVVQRYSLQPDRVRVIPNYVDTMLFAPGPWRDRCLRRICYVGRLDQEKNPLGLIEAIQGLNVELIIVGNGSLRESLRREVDLKGLPVTFRGNVPNEELPRILNSSGAFVMPSFIEGHPKALLEAMSCGVPVIGSNVPGIRELIIDRRTGLLCNPTPETLRSAIKEVLGNPGMSSELGCAGRAYVSERFALDRVVELEAALLEELASDGEAPRELASEGASASIAS